MFKNILIVFFLLISSISVFINAKFYKSIKDQNIVTEVVDGDTFQLKSGKRVRLMGIDAPEYNRCGGQEAKQKLTDLILNKNVSLSEETTEAYGRSLALVFVGEKFINKIILQDGWGRTDYRKNSRKDELSQAFHDAQDKKLGIFSALCVNAPNKCLIKGNVDKSTYKKTYHLPGCRQYNQTKMEEDIDRYFCTEAEAQKAGFSKAGGCP